MKRISALLLASLLVLLLLPVLFASAVETVNAGGSTSIPVQVNVTRTDAPMEPEPLYSLDLSWGSMVFDYQITTHKSWDSSNMMFKETYTGKWLTPNDSNAAAEDLANNQIRLINRSSEKMGYTMSFTPSDSFRDVSGTLSLWVSNKLKPIGAQTVTINSPSNPDVLDAGNHIQTVDLTVSGTLPDTTPAGQIEVGTVTVRVSTAS